MWLREFLDRLRVVKSKEALTFLWMFMVADLFLICLCELVMLASQYAFNGRYDLSFVFPYHFALVLAITFLMMKLKKRQATAIHFARMSMVWLLSRLAITFLTTRLFAFSPGTIMQDVAGNYLAVTDKKVVSDGYGEDDRSYWAGEMAMVTMDDDRWIDRVNASLASRDLGCKVEWVESLGCHLLIYPEYGTASSVSTRNYIFWRAAVAYGHDPVPKYEFPLEGGDARWIVGIFTVNPFVILELLVKEIPCMILYGFILWLCRGYIAPSVFSPKPDYGHWS
ncbi:MAG: hypothetical protein U0176_18810 [Bacteroidia bacterium]